VNVKRVERKTRVASPSRSTEPFAKDSRSTVFLAQIEPHNDSTTTISKCSTNISQVFSNQTQARTAQEALPSHPAELVHRAYVPRSILNCLFLQPCVAARDIGQSLRIASPW
jgi:hypothetical protein